MVYVISNLSQTTTNLIDIPIKKVLIHFQNRPRILCMSATMREVTDSCTRQSLGISSFLEIKRNPINPRISFINTKGKLNVNNIAQMLEKGKQCPRILIFEKSLVDCGLLYLAIKKVYHYLVYKCL